MKLLITGGTGYLGSCLASRLVNDGHEVGCLVRDNKKLNRLTPMRDMVQLFPVSEMVQALQSFCPECVIHTACTYSRGSHTELDVLDGNLLFPFHVLQAAIAAGVKTWINTGSCLPPNLNSYSLAKNQFREWGRYYADRGILKFIHLSMEHFYGPDAPKDHFLSWVIYKLKNNEPLELTSGVQRRDFIYIEDVLNVFTAALSHNFKMNYVDIPVGTGEAPTICEVVKYLKVCMGSHSELRFGAVPQRPGEPDSNCDTKQMIMLGCPSQIQWKKGLYSMLHRKAEN